MSGVEVAGLGGLSVRSINKGEKLSVRVDDNFICSVFQPETSSPVLIQY